jgi:hypothetical protein
MSFVKDGLELVIDTNSGEAFASTRATARMVEKNESTIRDFLAAREFDLKSAEINTPGGIQGARLLNELQIYDVCEKYKPSLLKAFAQAGLRIYLHKLAGFEVKSTAAPQSPSILPKLTPNIPDTLSILTHGQLKRLFYYRINIECGNGSVEQLVEDIDPIFWQADSKSVAIAFEQHCLNLEKDYVEFFDPRLKAAKRAIRLREKYIANLSSGSVAHLVPDFERYYHNPVFKEDDRWLTSRDR